RAPAPKDDTTGRARSRDGGQWLVNSGQWEEGFEGDGLMQEKNPSIRDARSGRGRTEVRRHVRRENWRASLDGGEEGTVGGDVAMGHARRVEGEAGIAVAVEEDEAAGGASALGEKMDGLAGGEIGGRGVAGRGGRWVNTNGALAKKIDGGFGQDDFHNGFAVAGAGDAAGFGVGITAAADER